MQASQLGTTLVEVMLASVLGVLLAFSLIQIYLTVQKTFNLQQAIISMQENGRFATHFLSESIHMAGYSYCDATADFVNADLAIHGYGNNLPTFLAKLVKKDTDSLEVGECTIRDKKEQFEQFAFFIGPTDRKDRLGNNINALYVKSRTEGNKRELVAGVEDMQIRYGIVAAEGDKNISQYLMADNVQDWNKVRAVKIALLLRSELPLLIQPEAYEFGGKRLPPDRFLHRERHSYVALREL